MTKQGGSRPGSGAKKLPKGEGKEQLSIYIEEDYIFEWARIKNPHFKGDLKAAKQIVQPDLKELFYQELKSKLVASWGKDTTRVV